MIILPENPKYSLVLEEAEKIADITDEVSSNNYNLYYTAQIYKAKDEWIFYISFIDNGDKNEFTYFTYRSTICIFPTLNDLKKYVTDRAGGDISKKLIKILNQRG